MRQFCLWICLAAAGCAVGPDPRAPDISVPSAFERTEEVLPYHQELAWWDGFDDETLRELIKEARSENLTIVGARARLAEAEAFIVAERSDLLPTIDGEVRGTTRSAISDGEVGDDSASAGLVMSFVPDLFGSRRRELQAAIATANAERFSVADAERLISVQVASTYLELRRIDARIALLGSSLELQNQTLEIVRLRAEAGIAADLDVQRALADLARTRAQRGPFQAARADADTLLSVLVADQPFARAVEPTDEALVPSYAGTPGIGTPTELLRRRPDLRAAEEDVIAAAAFVGAELADLYPSLSLPGSITTDLTDSGTAVSTVASISAVLDVPLFDLGRRRAEVRAARARSDAALAAYEQTLLGAFREVETALVRIESAKARRDDLAIAVEASERSFSQLQALYTEGLAGLIDVLDAQRQLIASREAFVDSEAQLAAAVIDLYGSLG